MWAGLTRSARCGAITFSCVIVHVKFRVWARARVGVCVCVCLLSMSLTRLSAGCRNVVATIFVVDSNDRERMDEAAEELEKIMRDVRSVRA